MLLLGLLGSALILIAWLIGIKDELKAKKDLIELKFSFVTLLGIIVLTVYSFLKKDIPFFVLNVGLFFIIIFEIFYTIMINRRSRK